MAIKTFHVLNTAAVTPDWNSILQEGGSAPAAALSVYGWTVAKTATAYWIARLGATARTATSQGTSWIDAGESIRVGTSGTLTSDAFRSPSRYTGTFASGTWSFSFGMRTGAATHSGRMRVAIWAGPNSDASGGSNRKLSVDTAGSIITLNATATTFTSTISFNPGALTLNNEYLFFAVEWQGTTAGTSNSCTAQFYQSACTITTPDFAEAKVGPLVAVEGADTAIISGTIVATGDLIVTEAADTALFDGGIFATGPLVVVEAADTATVVGTVENVSSGPLVVVEATDTATVVGTVENTIHNAVLAVVEYIDLALFSGNISGVPSSLMPDSTVANGGWVDQSESANNIYQSINEEFYEDANFVQSPIINGVTADLSVRLFEGSTEIAEWIHTDISPISISTAEQTLTAPQYAAISNFNNLFVEFDDNHGDVYRFGLADPALPPLQPITLSYRYKRLAPTTPATFTYLGLHHSDYNIAHTTNTLATNIGTPSADRYILVAFGSGNGANSNFPSDPDPATVVVGATSLTKLGEITGTYGSVMMFGGLVPIGSGNTNIVITAPSLFWGDDCMMAWKITGKALVGSPSEGALLAVDASVQVGDFVATFGQGHDYGGTKSYIGISTENPIAERVSAGPGAPITASSAEFIPTAANTTFHIAAAEQWGAMMAAVFR